MAYIKVPTGQYRTTATLTRNSFLYYRCLYCGREVLETMHLKGVRSETYHVLNSQETKNERREEAAAGAKNQLNASDNSLFNAVNIKKDYSKIEHKVVCPHCGKTQPWSQVGDFLDSPLRNVWFVLTAVLLLVTVILWVKTMMAAMPVFWVPAAALLATVSCAAFFPLLYKYRTARRADQYQNDPDFTAPVYYNASNLDDLLHSPAAPLLEEQLRAEEKRSR